MRINNIKLIILAFLVLGITTLISCEKDNVKQVNSVSEVDKYSTNSILVDPTNTSNEYDYIGKEHNEMLVYFVDSVINPSSLEEHFVYDYYFVEGLPTEGQMINIIKQANYNPDDYTGLMAELYNENIEIYNYYIDVLTVLNNSESIQSKVISILALENSIDYTLFNSHQNMAIKSMFSVARHSTVLWATVGQGGLGCRRVSEPNYIGGSERSHDIVMADIGGTLTSALFTGNPFTALAGGACSSAWEWGFGG